MAGMSVVGLVELVVALLALSGAVALFSLRLRVPYTLALVIAGLLIGVAGFLPGVGVHPDLILFLFLPALLFEGAWSLDLGALAADWLPVFLLAVPGLLLSTAIIAVVLHLGLGLPWLFALLLGAVLSPTDPLAALALFRQLGMPERLRVILEGESLFNDGIGAAVFEIVLGLLLATLGLPSQTFGLAASDSAWLLALESLWLIAGGLALGLAVAWVASLLLRLVDSFLFETSLTFTVAYGVYLLATLLHASGILAVIAAGMVMGSVGRRAGMSVRTSEAADDVWQFTGYLANSFLFLLLGLQFSGSHLLPSLPGIGWAVLGLVIARAAMLLPSLALHDALARWLSPPPTGEVPVKAVPARGSAPPAPPARRGARVTPGPTRRLVREMRRRFAGSLVPVPRLWRPILLFSGLRGALSIALVLSLPVALPLRTELEVIVYGVVLVTLVGQGLLLRVALPRWPSSGLGSAPNRADSEAVDTAPHPPR